MDEPVTSQVAGDFSPIAIFCYKRESHLLKTLRFLLQCPEFSQSPVFLFGDGPRSDAEINAVDSTRKMALSMLPAHTKAYFKKDNIGLSRSISDGVSKVLSEYSSVIVIEDDLIVHPLFLRFMNDALTAYKNDNSIFQISGYMFPLKTEEANILGNSVFAVPYITSWGWATWADRWQLFDLSCPGWESMQNDVSARYRFNANNNYDYWDMLRRKQMGLVDSWAIAWYYAVFSHAGMTIFPPMSLVQNNGFDGSGSNGNRFVSNYGVQFSTHYKMPSLKNDNRILNDAIKIYQRALFRSSGGWVRYFISVVRTIWR